MTGPFEQIWMGLESAMVAPHVVSTLMDEGLIYRGPDGVLLPTGDTSYDDVWEGIMSALENPQPADSAAYVMTETGYFAVTEEEAAYLYGLGLLRWNESGEWESDLAGIELSSALKEL